MNVMGRDKNMKVGKTVKTMMAAALLMLGGAMTANVAAQEGERIAAVVNDDIVSMRDLEERLKMAIINSRVENSPEMRRRFVPQVLRKLVEERLQWQEATRQGVNLTEAEIARTLRNVEEQNRLPPGGLEAMSRRDGIDFNSLLNQIKVELAWLKLIRTRYSGSIRISDAEIDSQLAIIKSNLNRPQYLLAEIFLSNDSASQEEEVRALADRIVLQTRQGAPFSALARQFSQAASAAVGGDIGWIYEGQLPAEIEATVKSLQPAQTSNPIKTLTGYHIVHLRNRRSGGQQDKSNSVLDLAQIFMPIPQNMRPEEARIQAGLVQTAASAAENCDDMARLAKELNSPQNPRVGKVSVGSLPANLQAVLADLPAGKVTPVVKNAGGIAAYMVCSRQDESAIPSREEISSRLEIERLDIQARRIMRDLRRTAIIDVRI